jgi:hypothetical protein
VLIVFARGRGTRTDQGKTAISKIAHTFQPVLARVGGSTASATATFTLPPSYCYPRKPHSVPAPAPVTAPVAAVPVAAVPVAVELAVLVDRWEQSRGAAHLPTASVVTAAGVTVVDAAIVIRAAAATITAATFVAVGITAAAVVIAVILCLHWCE